MERILTRDYKSHFNALEYIDINYRRFDPNDETNTNQQMRVFIIKTLRDMFEKGTIVGDVLLDIGCGPVCYTSAVACQWVNEVVLLDKSSDNISILRKWKDGDQSHVEAIMKYIADISGSRYSWKTLDRMLAEKVSILFEGDITDYTPLAGSGLEHRMFDIITAILCMICASESNETYEQCVINISRHLKRGGYLVIADVLEKPHFHVGKYTFQIAFMRSNAVKDILVRNGFEIVEWVEAPFTNAELTFKMMVCVAKKV